MDSDTQDRGDGAPTEHGSTALDIDVHKLGVWMVALGGAAMTIGLVADAIRHANDPALSAREGIFDLAGVPHALFFGGIAVAILGLLAMLSAKLYKPGRRVTVGRRLSQVGIPLAALVLIGGCAGLASSSALGSPPAAGSAAHTHTDAAAASADGHTHSDASTTDTTGSAGHTHTDTAAVAPTPYDPTKPIDLSGVPGVTPEEQARAENLIAITLIRLPQWADYHTAEAAGYKSIGDALTGDEHFINIATFSDGRILDPDHPESLVYEPNLETGEKKLVAAMYMLDPDKTLDQVPDVGGALTQWHIHNNLCFTTAGQVGGLTTPDGVVPAAAREGQPGADAPRVDHAAPVRTVRGARGRRRGPDQARRDPPLRPRARRLNGCDGATRSHLPRQRPSELPERVVDIAGQSAPARA